MRLALEHDLPGGVDEVLTALIDPAFIDELGTLPKLAPPELLEQQRDGDAVVQRVRYRFTGDLSSAVTRVVDRSKLTWVVETTLSMTARRATFRIIPDHYGSRLRCSGTHTFTDRGASTLRRIDGELTVSFPLVGKAVERAILGGLEEHLDAEASLLARWVQEPR